MWLRVVKYFNMTGGPEMFGLGLRYDLAGCHAQIFSKIRGL